MGVCIKKPQQRFLDPTSFDVHISVASLGNKRLNDIICRTFTPSERAFITRSILELKRSIHSRDFEITHLFKSKKWAFLAAQPVMSTDRMNEPIYLYRARYYTGDDEIPWTRDNFGGVRTALKHTTLLRYG